MKNFVMCALILVAMISSACGSDKPTARPSVEASASATGSGPKPVTVEVFEVKASDGPGYQSVPAVISVEGTALVLAQRDGTIMQLEAQEGVSVSKGKVIARLGDDDLRASLRQAELEVERLLVEERQYEAMIQLNRSELEQEAALHKEGLTSKRLLDRAQFKLNVAIQELERTRLATRASQAKVDGSKIEIQKSVVRAPINGVIARRYIHLGTSVVKNDKLFEISQPGPFEVRFQLPQADRHRLGRGSVVDLSLAGSNQIIARARIRRVDQVADAASNTVGFLADVIGRTSLMTGLAVNVHIPNGAAVSSVWIPRSAFPSQGDLRSGAAGTLFVLSGGQCVLRAVLVKTVEGDQAEVSSGLSVGDQVIVSPPAGLKAGDVVEVQR